MQISFITVNLNSDNLNYMNLKDFAVERYFSKYEFNAKYMLSSSDCDGYSLNYVLDLASDVERNRWDNLHLGYTETKGSEPLRMSIMQHYRTIQLDEILVSSPGEANFILMNVMLSAGDHVVCISPAYQSLYQIAEDIGCVISFWLPSEINGKWYFDPDNLKSLITDKTKLIIVNFPHNPTGFCPTHEEFYAIIEMARKNGIPIFSDEMYRFLQHSKVNMLPSLCDLYENGISLWGMAKTFGLAGLRLGWLTSKNKTLLKKIENFKDYLTICNSATSEVLATIALNNLDSFVAPNIEKIRTNLKIFGEFHTRNEQIFDFYTPSAGSTAFIKLKINKTTFNFAEELVSDRGIMVLPSEMFNYGTSHIRIGFGRQNMPFVIEIFEDYLSKYR